MTSVGGRERGSVRGKDITQNVSRARCFIIIIIIIIRIIIIIIIMAEMAVV